jgi:hypothetical protein
MRGLAAILVLVLAEPGAAEPMGSSLRPMPNPYHAGVVVAASPVVAVQAEGLATSLRPRPRPRGLTERIAALRAAGSQPQQVGESPEVDLASIPPASRKERRRQEREQRSMKGAVCGVAAIKGKKIAPIRSNVRGCGVPDAVAVTSVAGVRLSQAATVDCSIAKALNAWVDQVAQPAFDGKLVELRVAAHYACRGRNNVRGARISEHGKGNAIDISAFVLANGRTLTVKDNYNRLLRRIYKAACPYFKTALGPGSDGYHEDHFHFDTADRQSGGYCR